MYKNIIFYLLFFPLIISAQRELEIDYPGGLTTTDVSIPEYVQYIYYFIIGISGIIALVVIVLAGFQYLSSAGSPERIKDSKKRIISAFTGLLIIFFSWIIINELSPVGTKLEDFKIPEIPSLTVEKGIRGYKIIACNIPFENIGILLEEDDEEELARNELRRSIDLSCLHISRRKIIQRSVYPHVYIFPGVDKHYGLVLRGKFRDMQLLYNTGDEILESMVMDREEMVTLMPFTMNKTGNYSYLNYPRKVQLFKYIGGEDNHLNLKVEDENYNFNYGPHSTERRPISFFALNENYNNDEEENSEEDCGTCSWIWTIEEESQYWQSAGDSCEGDCFCVEPESPGSEMGEIEATPCSLPEEETESFLRIRSLKVSYQCIKEEEISDDCEISYLPIIIIFNTCEDISCFFYESTCLGAIIESTNYNLGITDLNYLCAIDERTYFPCAKEMIIISGYWGIN